MINWLKAKSKFQPVGSDRKRKMRENRRQITLNKELTNVVIVGPGHLEKTLCIREVVIIHGC